MVDVLTEAWTGTYQTQVRNANRRENMFCYLPCYSQYKNGNPLLEKEKLSEKNVRADGNKQFC
jgi:hypothetical protein